MANVSFLKGLQSDFNGLSSYVAGAFYLTTDTNRLYFADTANKANYLNKYVHTVASKTALETAINDGVVVNGDFAYVSDLNALVAIQGKSYVQINAYENDNDNTKTTALSFQKSVDNNVITINYTLDQKTTDVDGKAHDETPITGSFTISAADIGAVVAATEVDVTSSISNNKAVIKTTGIGSAGDGITLESGNDVISISGSADKVVISGVDTTYTLSSDENVAGIVLTDNNGDSNEVDFVAGKQMVVSGLIEGEINIAHADVATNKATHATDVADGGAFTAVNSLTIDNGHITGYTVETYTIPESKEYTITDVTADNAGKISVTMKDQNGAGEAVVSGADLYYVVNGETVYNQGVIDFYTKDEIDSKIHGIDAMVYRGTVGTSGATVSALPSSDVQNGDTYKVATAGTWGTHECEVGDLLIATGAEVDGKISGTITWTYVPAGDDTDSQFALSAANGTNAAVIKLTNTTDNNSAAGAVTLAQGNDIAISASGDTITIAHEAFTTTSTTDGTAVSATSGAAQTLEYGKTFVALAGIKTDNGHVTGYKATTFTMPESDDTTYALSAVADGSDVIVRLQDNNQGNSDITIAPGASLTASNLGNKISIAHATLTPTHDNKTTAEELDYANNFSAITSLTFNNTGHVTGYTTKKFALPEEVKYTLAGATIASLAVDGGNGIQITDTLTGNGGAAAGTSVFGVTSKSLKLVADATNHAYSIDLEWGSF